MNFDQASQPERLKGNSFLKAITLITIGLFLISAPAPDARIISDITHSLIVSAGEQADEASLTLDVTG